MNESQLLLEEFEHYTDTYSITAQFVYCTLEMPEQQTSLYSI